jgi:WD40 repeat protein
MDYCTGHTAYLSLQSHHGLLYRSHCLPIITESHGLLYRSHCLPILTYHHHGLLYRSHCLPIITYHYHYLSLSAYLSLPSHHHGLLYRSHCSPIITKSSWTTVQVTLLTYHYRFIMDYCTQVTDLVFLAKSGLLVSSSKDSSVKVWELEHQHCCQTLTVHRGEVWALDADPEEHRLVTGAADNGFDWMYAL